MSGGMVMPNHRYKILVVEDDQNLRLTLTELLRMEGFTVVTARDGDEGYLQAMAHQPDLVITDLNMPILDGVVAVILLRRHRGKMAGMPIIALTPCLPDYSLPSKMYGGIARFIDKSSIRRQRLSKTVRTLLGASNPLSAA